MHIDRYALLAPLPLLLCLLFIYGVLAFCFVGATAAAAASSGGGGCGVLNRQALLV